MDKQDIIQVVVKELQRNAKAEAQASEDYTIQLQVITQAIKEATEIGEIELVNTLKELYQTTEEKIADELTHNTELIAEYSYLTGIKIKEN